MRSFIIDTDTASDDVWALIELLRASETGRVEAVTTVFGNFPVELCTKNALHAIETAGEERPPVYAGCSAPLQSGETYFAEFCHGADGLGNMNLPCPEYRAQQTGAVDALLELVLSRPGELEILTIGPLTNLAEAIRRDARFASSVKKLWVLGGTAAGRGGNMTPQAEYNVYCDPEAAQLVLDSGADQTWVVWDAPRDAGRITPEDIAVLSGSADPAARFCARCTKRLQEFYLERSGEAPFTVVDTALVTAALYPQTMAECAPVRASVVLEPGERRGAFVLSAGAPNCELCTALDPQAYREALLSLLTSCPESV